MPVTSEPDEQVAPSWARDGGRFRGSWHVFGGRVVVGAGTVTVSVLTVVVYANVRQLGDTWQRVAVVAGLVAIAVWVVTYIATAEVTVTSDHVVKRRWWLWRTRVPRDRVYGLGAALRQPLERRVVPMLFLRGRDEHGQPTGPRIALSGWYWDVDDLRGIAALLDVPIVEETIDGAEFERRAPGALSLRRRRPVLWAFGLVFGGTAVVFAVLVALLWTGADLGSDGERSQAQAEVSPQVAAAQDARADDLVATLPDRAWRDAGERYQGCRDRDRRDGWQRVVMRVSDGPVDDAEIAAVVRGLEALGYVVEDEDEAFPRTVTGRPPPDRTDPTSEETAVVIEASSVLVIATSDCDVPAGDRSAR